MSGGIKKTTHKLTKERKNTNSKPITCSRCRKPRHKRFECHSTKDINGNYIYDKKTKICNRCGRFGHRKWKCKAKTYADGQPMRKRDNFYSGNANNNKVRKLYDIKRKKAVKAVNAQICWRCGRSNHQLYKHCRSSFDINGDKLSKKYIELGFKPLNNIKQNAHDTVHMSCDGNNSNNHKRKFSNNVYDEFQPVFKKQKVDDSKPIQIKIETDIAGDDRRHTIGCSNCNNDLQRNDIWRCSRCKKAFYCDRQCQLDHWETHKRECGKAVHIKLEKIAVDEWNHWGIIYWLNRVNDNMFNDVKCRYLRKHIVMGKLKGCDLLSINKVTLRMLGISDLNEQDVILNAMSDIVMNDNFDNVLANRMKIDDIPMRFVDPVLYEIMDEPVKVMQSRYIYDKNFISEYIVENKSDPITQRFTDLSDIVPCEALSVEMDKWKQQHLISIS